MNRFSDLPEPYAVVVIVPGTPPITSTVDGRIARIISWLLDHRGWIESMRGSVTFDFGKKGLQTTLNETFRYQPVAQSKVARPEPATEDVPKNGPKADNLTAG